MCEQFLTVGDIAKKLNVKKPTIYGWIFRGVAPPYIRLNGTVRFPEMKFTLWLAQRVVVQDKQKRAAA